MTEVKTNKKLIEVALPLEAINAASAREKSIRHGHPSTLHLWWARRPLAAARAVIFAQMVDDPSAHPDIFPTLEAQEKERQRLFRIIEELVKWENTTNEAVLESARDEIWQSWRAACAENAGHPRARELFDRQVLPAFHDPFAGGGALPLEAQRLGLEAYASDLNPVAVLICKAMVEIPPRFAGQPPVNPEARKDPRMFAREWRGASGLADDVRYYGKWMRDEAERRIGHHYPRVEITREMAEGRPELESLIGQKLTVIAWLWARTVKSPNPAFRDVDVPLVSSFMLSTRPGKEAYVEPVIEGSSYRFAVKTGKPKNLKTVENGTKLGRGADFRCLMSNTPMSADYVRGEFKAKHNDETLMAIVADGPAGRVYLPPVREQDIVARSVLPSWYPEQEMNQQTSNLVSGRGYGIKYWYEIFTQRQLEALTVFSGLVGEARDRARRDALSAGLANDSEGFGAGGTGAPAYADAVAAYLAFAVSKTANTGSSITSWMSDRGAFRETFARQAIPMVWDFAECNPLSGIGGSLDTALEKGIKVIEFFPSSGRGHSEQADAAKQSLTSSKVVSTDPPYYDNIGYADLSDFFYVWLRRSLRLIYPSLFSTLTVPKIEELVATPYRHGGKVDAAKFFLDGMTRAMKRLAEQTHPAFPTTIYYAYKQSEAGGDGAYSTGWDAFLEAVMKAGFVLTGTWPMRTEGSGRIIAKDTNALASSIVLVCRPRSAHARITTRRDFISRLKTELPMALAHLQRGSIAPVDLEQAAIGPGMAIYSSYAEVLDAEGKSVSVQDALRLINQTLYEVLTEQEGDYDSDTRWALVWFEQHGFTEGDYGTAEQLSKSKNTSVEGMLRTGILISKGGRVRLLKPSELRAEWEPEKGRLTVWEMTHQLIRELESGEAVAAGLATRLGSKSEVARELAYRLYTICERKKRSAEAALYNGLVKSWPEILRLAREEARGRPQQGKML